MNEILFNRSDYFIEEKVVQIRKRYNFYSETGDAIGPVRQIIKTRQKILSLFVSKRVLPCKLKILNVENQPYAMTYSGERSFCLK